MHHSPHQGQNLLKFRTTDVDEARQVMHERFYANFIDVPDGGAEFMARSAARTSVGPSPPFGPAIARRRPPQQPRAGRQRACGLDPATVYCPTPERSGPGSAPARTSNGQGSQSSR